ncbi:hypothetical protein [Shewanella sp.]|uniref:hypothetical protein n=1 Tax=Shewanella sp. TaxID=50422 RepID=UPI003567628D
MTQPQSAATLSHPDSIIKSATAAVQRGVARADGKLCLTESGLEFTPYNSQFGLGPYQLSRTEIAKAEKCLGKGGGFLPVTSDAMRLTMKNGDTLEFIVANVQDWISALNALAAPAPRG